MLRAAAEAWSLDRRLGATLGGTLRTDWSALQVGRALEPHEPPGGRSNRLAIGHALSEDPTEIQASASR